ncbi:MAG: DedA family protein [Alphaproteobacteria bacterium]
MEDFARQLIDFIKLHQEWAIAVMFITAFGESFVFLGLAFPGTTLLVAAGVLIKSGDLSLWPIAIGAVLGAVLGDTVSYWIGWWFGGRLTAIWPFTRRPELLASGVEFFRRHGGKSVFIGRFFGPIRAVIPLAAGMMRMPPRLFWIANVTSALVWAPMLLLAGDALARAGERLVGSEGMILLVVGGTTLAGIIAALWAAFRAARPKG